MSNWFECKVKYGKVDGGKAKKVSETYLVDAISFSEAEERVSREVAPFVTGEFAIMGMKKAQVNEIFPHEEGDRWFKCKVIFITVDEVKATEKKISSTILVFGSTIDDAWDHLTSSLSDSMSDYEVASIAETNIMDIFPYSSETGSGLTPEKKNLGVDANADYQDLLSPEASSAEDMA
ncbi:MAG: DUF4494 domain-containing protein [Paludibacteraceae bacterium]|nr:DUF4494 domain-containing protein [Candidatus Physcocola equi]MCQ2233136.1 DUF4494 domain-containing protein [Paludibacteraceae bacterium]